MFNPRFCLKKVEDEETRPAHEPASRYIAIMIEALARLRKLPVAMAAFKRTLKVELFFLAEAAIEEASAKCVTGPSWPPPAPTCDPNACRLIVVQQGCGQGAALFRRAGRGTHRPAAVRRRAQRHVRPVPVQVAGDRYALARARDFVGRTADVARPFPVGAAGSEWNQHTVRQTQAEQLDVLLRALYGRYTRAFRRIDFALARILNVMPAAPANAVRLDDWTIGRLGGWTVGPRGDGAGGRN